MKRLLTMLAAAVLLLSPLSTSHAQAAADMRLEKFTGTVSVTDANESQLNPQSDMRLFDGYGVSTRAKSYAWFSLDKTKALKLDALSAAKLHKAGSKLEIKLQAGKLLCDVSAPLSSSESLEIRTSTTVTGIRGTVLVVKVIDEYTTVIYVLEGKVTVTETDPETGKTRMISVAAGQLATSTARSASSGATGNYVTLRPFAADEVDAFVLDEIANNPAFVEHLRSTDSEEVLKLLEQAEVLKKEETPAGTSGNSEPGLVNIAITTDATDEFINALANNTYLNLTVSSDGHVDLEPGQNVNVGANQVIQLSGANMDMESNNLNNAGTIHVDVDSNLYCSGTFTNSSSNTLNVYGLLKVDGTLINTGVINIYGKARVLHLSNDGGEFNIFDGGTLEIYAAGSATNDGTIANGGTIKNNGTITNDGTIENNGAITNDGTIENSGDISGDGDISGNEVQNEKP